MALKGNQQNLHIDVEECYVFTDLEWLDWRKDWEGLNSIELVIRECEENGVKSVEKRYFISSMKVGAESFLQAVRSHWGVETGSGKQWKATGEWKPGVESSGKHALVSR